MAHNSAELIKLTKDTEYIKRCVEDRYDFGFDSTQTMDLIKSTRRCKIHEIMCRKKN